ncbi:MAG: MBOAT family protein [Bacteroidales bacterium]|nr:MBOAT family protein [Bacteroidales bacterium]
MASYFFYGFVDWRMLPFLLCITIVFYLLGSAIKRANGKSNYRAASGWKTLGVVLGVGVLVYFKYLDFFAGSVASFLNAIGVHVSWSTLNIVLPVGLSFFIFKLISYVLEIHREKIEPAENFIEFATYIAFFPTMLSGPIDRPNTFLPQLRKNHSFNFNQAIDGCQQILWGIFTKMVIADNLALFTGEVWRDYDLQSPGRLVMTILLSPVQVYADFDGYSNMAIGVGKILGFSITKNFDHPLLARNVSEYWRRWHISLTKWITDYVFMPLNIRFRNLAKLGIFIAITVNLVVIGLWHGANWTYAVFGLFHSILFIPLILSGSLSKNKKLKESKRGFPLLTDLSGMVLTYIIIGLGHVIFFSRDIPSFIGFFKTLGTFSFKVHDFFVISVPTLIFTVLLFVLEWITRKREFVLQRPSKDYSRGIGMILIKSLAIAVIIALFGNYNAGAFIYFQF